MATNVGCDHRVTVAREAMLDGLVQGDCTGAALADALVSYKNRRVRQPMAPDFAIEELNAGNILSGGASGSHRILRDVSLARLIDLNGLMPVYQSGQSELGLFSGLTRFNATGVAAFVERELTQNRESFIEDVLAAMDVRRRQGFHHHPCWVTFWADLLPFLEHGIGRAAQALGLEVPSGNWMIAVRYPARRAGTVARPTQLDAGWYASHFPSPPGPSSAGGHPVDLEDGPRDRLLPEFIHEEIELYVGDWIDTGRLVGQARGSRASSLEVVRGHHHDCLRHVYGEGVLDWMSTAM